MSIFEPTVTVAELIALQIAGKLGSKAAATREQRVRSGRPKGGREREMVESYRLAMASMAFPNDVGGYVRREKKPVDMTPLTPEQRFKNLTRLYANGPTNIGVVPRKPTRGRSKRRRIIGVRWWPRAYSFNPVFRACLAKKLNGDAAKVA